MLAFLEGLKVTSRLHTLGFLLPQALNKNKKSCKHYNPSCDNLIIIDLNIQKSERTRDSETEIMMKGSAAVKMRAQTGLHVGWRQFIRFESLFRFEPTF